MTSSSLRPGWTGKGFQPPAPQTSDRAKADASAKQNPFALLDEDDAELSEGPTTTTTRLRSDSAVSGTSSKGGGRSLADLAANTSAPPKKNVMRYTREKLLSMRPNPKPQAPDVLKDLQDTPMLSEEPQDPVCFDDFEPDKIWATTKRKNDTRNVGGNKKEGGNRWQRGMALPTATDKKNADNPNDLWDDPLASAEDDLAAFSLDDEPFDFEKMAAASAQLDLELKGPAETEEEQAAKSTKAVSTARPLATAGTTIQSGSGDNVNVFEDFDDPGEEESTLKPVVEETDASSQLMAMIGVNKDADKQSAKQPEQPVAPWGVSLGVGGTELAASQTSTSVPGLNLPLNPWGGALSMAPEASLGIQSQLREAELQKAREEELRRRQQEEEAKRAAIAKQQAEERARQIALQEQQRQQQAGVQSQVEQVLMERICAILESTWGRSDLMTILQRLHADDPRVTPLLNNIDALRALILRNPQRAVLRSDPSFVGELVVLQMTNAQWQERQQAQMRIQKEDRVLSEVDRIRSQINYNAPWYYSDPQGNIQGPFGGSEMRQWLEAGYFKGNLPISQQPQGPFVPLQNIFVDLQMAFVPPQNSNETADEAARKEAEERKAAEEAERKRQEELRKREEGKQAAAARETTAREQARQEEAKKASEEKPNESSTQLKMMLGLGATQQPKSKKGGEEKAEQRSLQPKEAPASAPAAPAWGAAAQNAPKKTMAEIQKEEARKAAIAAMNKESSRTSSSGWANVAAKGGGSTGWSGGAAAASPAISGTVTTALKPAQVAARSNPQASLSSTPSNGGGQAPKSSANAAKAFGALMPPELEKWCKDQMMKLNGTEDLTLVSFCMSLTDSDEIRQYLTAYLGSTPQVNSFAGEFINRKNGKTQSDEWETTATTKKKSKKKGGR